MEKFNEIEIDKLDAYFRNELSDLERAEVETKVHSSEEYSCLFQEMEALYLLREKVRRMAVIRDIGSGQGDTGSPFPVSSLTLIHPEE